MQQSSNAAVTNSLRSYGTGAEALLLIASEDEEIARSLVDVFLGHSAPYVDPERDLPWCASDVGDCRIGEDGVTITIKGFGSSFMGLRFESSWGTTPPEWHLRAVEHKRVWLGLVGGADYARLVSGGWSERLPSAWMLKLEVTP